MTIYVNKPSFSLREELNRLKKPSGIFGENLLRTQNSTDFYNVIGTNRNRVINGDFKISQRYGTSSSTPTSGTYPIDRWVMDLANADYDVQQITNDSPPGFNYSVKITTANSRSRTSYHFFNHAIEGYNVGDLRWGTKFAENSTLSFWVKASIAGKYSVSITNSGNNYSYPTTFTVNHSGTWEYKTISIPGAQGGTWNTTDGTGVRIKFNLNAGTFFDDAENQWTAADKHTVAGTIRIGETTGATLQLSGVQFEKGNVATPFDYRSYGQEFQMCQRYYERFTGYGDTAWLTGYGFATTLYFYLPWKVKKRADNNTAVSSSGSLSTIMNVYGTGNSSSNIAGLYSSWATASTHSDGLSFYMSLTADTYTPRGTAILWGIKTGEWLGAQSEIA